MITDKTDQLIIKTIQMFVICRRLLPYRERERYNLVGRCWYFNEFRDKFPFLIIQTIKRTAEAVLFSTGMHFDNNPKSRGKECSQGSHHLETFFRFRFSFELGKTNLKISIFP